MIRGARPATILFTAAAAASAGLLLAHGSHLTFLTDDWQVLVNRRGFSADSILLPVDQTMAIGPVLVYKVLQATLGMDSAFPYRVASVAAFIGSVAVLFVYLSRRIGEWPALAGAVAVLFFGAASEVLLLPFQLGYSVSAGAGLGALLALERGDRRGDLAAGGLLAASVLFSSLGLPFLGGAAVAIGIGPRATWPRRWLVVAVPAGLFALWLIGWGHEAYNSITAENVATAPLFMVDGFASSISSVLGLATPRDEGAIGALAWGRPLLVVGVALAGWLLWRRRRIPGWLVVVAATAAAFWLLAGVNERPLLDPLASRYQYAGAIFVLLIAAELVRGERIGRGALAAIFAVLVLSVPSNVNFLDQIYRVHRATSEIERADLAALEIARGVVDDAFALTEPVAHTGTVPIAAGPYFAAVDDFGSPAYTEDELAAAPEAAREAADSVLAAALGLRVERSTPPPAGAGCSSVPVSRSGAVADLPPGGTVVEAPADGAVSLRLRRFADAFTISAGDLARGEAEWIAIPADNSARPWQLELIGTGIAHLCRPEGD